MNPSVAIFLAGIVGTILMTGVLLVTSSTRYLTTNAFRALGSFISGDDRREAFGMGLLVHMVAGIGFSALYFAMAVLTGQLKPFAVVYLCTLLGFVHGFVFSFFAVIMVAEHHPLPQYRQIGFQVAFAEIFSHVIYGLSVGFVLHLALLTSAP